MATCNIFICHRRGDAVRPVGRLLQTLRNSYGDGVIHYGSHQASGGKGLCKESLHAMIEARVVLVMIGPSWATSANLNRLHETSGEPDPLRRWIALALTRLGAGGAGAPCVLPLLFDDATLPGKSSLPKDVKELARLPAMAFPQEETSWPERYAQLQAQIDWALGLAKPERGAWLRQLWQPVAQAMAQLQVPRSERLSRLLLNGRMARRR